MAKDLIHDIYDVMGRGVAAKRRPVPHMSIYGPFSIKHPRDVILAVARAAAGIKGFDYEVTGVGTFTRGHIFNRRKEVVFLKVDDADGGIIRFHDDVYNILDGRAVLRDPKFDKPGHFTPHITMALRESGLDGVEKYLKGRVIYAKGRICRVTLMKRGRILYEYDMETEKILNRDQALRRRNYCRDSG